jgi:hypothetical protein
MRWNAGFLSLIFFLGVFALPHAIAQNRVDSTDLAHHPMEASFDSGGQLDLHICSGEIHIVGSNHDKLSAKAGGEEGSTSTAIHARFESFGSTGKLWIEGCPSKNVTITVEVPRNSNLLVRVPAGDVQINSITGSKDVELHAGQLAIEVGNPADYFRVKASVITGSVHAQPFGEERDGVFRSFEKSGSGKYKLVAHVGAGDLSLK